MTNSKLARAALAAFLCVTLNAVASAALILSDPSPGTSGKWAKVTDPAYPAANSLYVINIGNAAQWYSGGDARLFTGFPHNHGANIAWGVGSRYTDGSVTPSTDGAIDTIDYAITTQKAAYSGVRVAMMLMQNGKFYRSNWFTQAPGSSTPIEVASGTGLHAGDFGEFSGHAYQYGPPAADGTANFASNPDFSAGGSLIQLGYLSHFDSSLNEAVSATAYQATSGWSATINFVPEPGTALLLAVAAAAALRRR